MKADAIKNGTVPRRGMWLVSPSRKIAYGPIHSVGAEVVVWYSKSGRLVRTSHETIHHGDYAYHDGIPRGFAIHELTPPTHKERS